MRIDKYLSACGVASRSEIKKLVKAGKITVNGEVAKKAEMHIDENSILGDALIKGYQMEQKDAIYPRIIIDKELVNFEKVSYRNFSWPIFKDNDSQICLNSLMFMYAIEYSRTSTNFIKFISLPERIHISLTASLYRCEHKCI